MLESPLIAEGAGLAARKPGQLLIGLPRDAADGPSPVSLEEYRHLKDTGLCGQHDMAEFVATMRDKIPLAYFALIENTLAGEGEVVNGTGAYFLTPDGMLAIHIDVAGDAPLDLPVKGVPLVAMRAPIQKRSSSSTAWAKKGSLSLDDVIPDAVRPLLMQAKQKQLVVSANALVFHGMYSGYSLFVHTPVTIQDPNGSVVSVTVKNRVDVTAAAAFVFPYDLAPANERDAIRALVDGRLEADEPDGFVTDFESHYLASAMVASYYRRWGGA